MRILVSTSWGTACGIADYAAQAISAIQTADPTLEFFPQVEALDPEWVLGIWEQQGAAVAGVWLNYHRGLHSRWTPEKVQQAQDRGVKVLITFHDTYGERPPDDLTQQLHDVADVFVVHEPCEGLPKQVLIRQGIPTANPPGGGMPLFGEAVPILGTIGFNFPWKNYDRLAEVTAACGWGLLLCCNNATTDDWTRWRGLNPLLYPVKGWLSTEQAVLHLGVCDATIFAYECANSGTSGAIRQGIAARKPVIAWEETRQFRDLLYDNAYGITWHRGGFAALPDTLRQVRIQRCDPGVVFLATRDSWTNQGKKYAALFQGLTS